MPNWVINRLSFENENVNEVMKMHFVEDENGNLAFDFNTLIKMPDDLKIERSSKVFDGLKLYLAKINPLIKEFGTAEDKCDSTETFVKTLYEMFGQELSEKIECYVLRPSGIRQLQEKYKENLSEVLSLGKKAFLNKKKYGFFDWYEWSIENWGTKWNSSNTYFLDENGTFQFDSAWSPAIPVIEVLSRMHPELRIIYCFSEEQMGYHSGKIVFDNGEKEGEIIFPQFSKEAYEMSFELWGGEDEYQYNPSTGTYEYVDPEEEWEE